MNADITVPDWATHILSDLTDLERDPHPVDASQVSKFTLELPNDVYFEYGFRDEEGNLKADPTNNLEADNPWYPNLSALTGPDYTPDAYADPEVKAEGRVLRKRLESQALDQTRRVTLYTPKGLEDEALPAIYVQDGTAYYRIARLADVLETLLQQEKVRPAHLVFIEPKDRTAEYRFNPDYRTFVTDEVIPRVEDELNVTDERVAMGASLGGLVSATLALHHPELFSTVVAQSGAFIGSPEEPDFYRGETSWVLSELKERDTLDLRWYTETGTLEWLTDINRQVRDVLEEKGYDHAYDERNAGHNWTNWRNGLGKALQFALAK